MKSLARCTLLLLSGVLLCGALAQRGARPTVDDPQVGALIEASGYGHIDQINELLAQGADINGANQYGTTPLLEAIYSGRLETAQLLIGRGANVNAFNNEGTTALMMSTTYCNVDVAKAIIKAGADVSAKNQKGETAWYLAKKNNLDCPIVAMIEEALSAKGQITSPEDLAGAPAQKPAQNALTAEQVQSIAEKAAEAAAGKMAAKGGDSSGSQKEEPLHSTIDEPQFHAPERPDDFAVVVGIENYDLFTSKALYAERDAEAASRYFHALGVPERHIATLLGSKATQGLLKSRIERWLATNVKPDSRVYFYFSGHGAPDAETKQAYLVPFDGDPSDLENTAYPIQRLYAHLKKLPSKQVLVFLDACFTGSGGRSVLPKDARPMVTVVVGAPSGEVKALTAAGRDQITGEMPGEGHGLFTYYLLQGINGAAQDASGHVTMKSLYEYLRPKVEDEAKLKFRTQTPQLLPADSPGDATLR